MLTEVDQDILPDLLPDLAEKITDLREELERVVETANRCLQLSSVAPLVAEALKKRKNRRGSARLIVMLDGKIYLETGLRRKTSPAVSAPQVDDLKELFPTG